MIISCREKLMLITSQLTYGEVGDIPRVQSSKGVTKRGKLGTKLKMLCKSKEWGLLIFRSEGNITTLELFQNAILGSRMISMMNDFFSL